MLKYLNFKLLKLSVALFAIIAVLAGSLTISNFPNPNHAYAQGFGDVGESVGEAAVKAGANALDSVDCEKKKKDGYVWVVFASDCMKFEDLFPTLMGYILTFASVIAAFIFIKASFNYLSSRGDPSKIADAKSMLINAVIGLVIISLSFIILEVLDGSFDGVGEINLLPFF